MTLYLNFYDLMIKKFQGAIVPKGPSTVGVVAKVATLAC